jgi:hypothetical protein
MLAVFLQGSSGGHMLLVEHARCADHSELVHNGEGHHHETGGYAESDSPTFQHTSSDPPEEVHEHCAFSADHRNALVAIGGAQLSIHAYEARVDFALASVFVDPSGARFRIAPKNSPPA